MKKRFHIPFGLTRFELTLWLTSSVVCTVSYLIAQSGDPLSLIASLIGATALIFVAKGHVVGQLLTVAFALVYGAISLHHSYFGEMITYLGMSAPMAIAASIAWIRNPSKRAYEVAVAPPLTRKKIAMLALLTIFVTVLFYFILAALGTANLTVSTISVTTSFAAASLTFLRSPYYALAYAANDIVLIVLWILAAIADISCLAMIACFVMFLANDIYGFINWRRMEKRQTIE